MKIPAQRITFILAILWTSLSVFLLLSPSAHIPEVGISFPGMDKLIHVVVFFIFALLWTLSLGAKRNTALLVLFLGITFSSATELLQINIAGRSRDIYDWYANCLGVFTGVLFALLFTRNAKKC